MRHISIFQPSVSVSLPLPVFSQSSSRHREQLLGHKCKSTGTREGTTETGAVWPMPQGGVVGDVKEGGVRAQVLRVGGQSLHGTQARDAPLWALARAPTTLPRRKTCQRVKPPTGRTDPRRPPVSLRLAGTCVSDTPVLSRDAAAWQMNQPYCTMVTCIFQSKIKKKMLAAADDYGYESYRWV